MEKNLVKKKTCFPLYLNEYIICELSGEQNNQEEWSNYREISGIFISTTFVQIIITGVQECVKHFQLIPTRSPPTSYLSAILSSSKVQKRLKQKGAFENIFNSIHFVQKVWVQKFHWNNWVLFIKKKCWKAIHW